MAGKLGACVILSMLLCVGGLAASVMEMPSGTQGIQSYKGKEGWQEEGVMPLSYVMAREKMRNSMRRQGWKLVMDIPLAGRGQNLSVWTRRGHKVLVRLWRIEAGRTGISWGEMNRES